MLSMVGFSATLIANLLAIYLLVSPFNLCIAVSLLTEGVLNTGCLVSV